MEFSNEQKLILYCSQARTRKDDHDKIKALSKLGLDWRYVLETAQFNGVPLLLYHNLKKIHRHYDIPSDTMQQLKHAYLSNTAKNTYMGHELCRLVKEFAEKCIDAIVLKGAALANLVYPDVGLRMYGDIDILIKKEDLPAVERLMPDLGYVSTADSIKEESHRKKHYHLAPFIHIDKNIVLEIHFNVTNRFPVNIDSWWERSRSEKILGYSARVLSPNDLFLHLCIHISKHGFRNIDLRDLCDISESIKCYGEEIDWAVFQKEVGCYPIDREVYSILYFVKKMFCTNESCLNWLTYQKSDFKLISLLEELVFCDDRDNVLTEAISKILVRNSLKDKLRIVVDDFFPDRKFMSERYSLPLFSKRVYFYYLIRPLMKIIKNRKYIGQFFNSLLRVS
jgi:hypothetical protein